MKSQAEQMREMCAKLVENGNFLHNDSPEAKWSKGCAAAIRALPLPEVAPVQPSPAEPDPVVWVKTEDRMPDCDLIYFVDVKHNIGERDVIYEGTYEWRQGQYPDRFVSARFGDIDAKAFTHWAERKPAVMPKMPVDTAQPVSNDVPVAQTDSRAEFEAWYGGFYKILPPHFLDRDSLNIYRTHYIDTAFQAWQSRQKELDIAKMEVNHWKANHADMVKRCNFLEQRPDLPVDRIPVYIALQAENTALKAKAESIDSLLSELEAKNAERSKFIKDSIADLREFYETLKRS